MYAIHLNTQTLNSYNFWTIGRIFKLKKSEMIRIPSPMQRIWSRIQICQNGSIRVPLEKAGSETLPKSHRHLAYWRGFYFRLKWPIQVVLKRSDQKNEPGGSPILLPFFLSPILDFLTGASSVPGSDPVSFKKLEIWIISFILFIKNIFNRTYHD